MATARTTGKQQAIPVEVVELAASVHHLSIAVDALLEEVKQDRDARADLRIKLAVLDAAVAGLKTSLEALRLELARASDSGSHGRPNRKQAAAVAVGGAGLGAGSITLWEIVQRLLG